MGAELINGQNLIESFAAFMSASSVKVNAAGSTQIEERSGALKVANLPTKLRTFITATIENADLGANPKLARLLQGDMSDYGNDQNKADAGLIRLLAESGFSPDDCDLAMRATPLMRHKWDSKRGSSTYGANTINLAFSNISAPVVDAEAKPTAGPLFSLEDGRVNFVFGGMQGREFAGPEIAPGRRLFPMKALSCIVSLGAVGKTTTVMAISASVAAGRSWNGHPTKKAGVILFCVEETQEEINRKVSAILADWPEADRNECLKNLLVISCVGKDARLTVIDYGAHRETSVASDVIALVKAHEERCGLPVSMVCFDHLQGFTSGDLNSSETAVTLARAANRIVAETGAAVVLTAHIAKANIGAEELSAGFTVGSLAFENAMRQVVGMIPMTPDVAKNYGLKDERTSYSWLGLIKNSYAAPEEGCWIHKRLVPAYHTVVAEPVELAHPAPEVKVKKANLELGARIVKVIQNHPGPLWMNRFLDRYAGKSKALKASTADVELALGQLRNEGRVVTRKITAEERAEYSIHHTVKTVLVANP